MFKHTSIRLALAAALVGVVLCTVAAWPGVSREHDIHNVDFEERFVAPARGRYVVQLTPPQAQSVRPSQDPLRAAFVLRDLDQSFDVELNVQDPPLFADFGVARKTQLRFQRPAFELIGADATDVDALQFTVTAQPVPIFDGHRDMAWTGLTLVAAGSVVAAVSALGHLFRKRGNTRSRANTL